jgi:hypothetical protein
METRNAHCPRCGCQVRLTLTPGPEHLGHATLPDGPALVCLDVCDCEDGRCPLTGERSAVMVARLARSGLAPDRFSHTCASACERMRARRRRWRCWAGSRARCTVCGTINRWIVDDLVDHGVADVA